jgi:hypothetical protein
MKIDRATVGIRALIAADARATLAAWQRANDVTPEDAGSSGAADVLGVPARLHGQL